jgi:hypothetical protein
METGRPPIVLRTNEWTDRSVPSQQPLRKTTNMQLGSTFNLGRQARDAQRVEHEGLRLVQWQGGGAGRGGVRIAMQGLPPGEAGGEEEFFSLVCGGEDFEEA